MTSQNTYPEPPPADPKSVEDFLRLGWEAYVHAQHAQAENYLLQAVALDPQSVEGYYALGLTRKFLQKQAPAIEAFQKAIDLIAAGGLSEDHSRATMLRHLSGWHILTLQSGVSRGEPNP